MMAKRSNLRGIAVAAALLSSAGPAHAAEDAIDFARDVRPILSQNCFACHGPDEQSRKAKLRVDTHEAIIAGEPGQAAVVPGKPSESLLMERIASTDPDALMPPPKSGKRLTAKQKETLRQWIADGAKWDKHWSFVPPESPVLPAVRAADWPISPVDHFVLARLEQTGLAPAPDADKATLLRRVSFDLTGLPPSPAEIRAFLADDSPSAYTKVVDRLLASPAFGEKWARQWLDLAGYADSNGYQRDGFRTVWPWRDWVIKSLNADLPYDRFITEQIAGDLLPNAGLDQKVATGFFRTGTVNVEAGTVPEADRSKQVVDRVNAFGTVFLGLTLECAQCHDHKYDPIPTRDYYSVYAYFNNTPIESRYRGNNQAALDFTDAPAVIVGGSAQDLARQSALKTELAALVKDCGDERIDKATAAKIRQLEARIERVPVIASLVLEELPEPRQTHVLKRGQFDTPGEKVRPGTLAALGGSPAGRNRLALASWVTDAENPLTARVAVNRWWAELFGRGLVGTLEDFGAQGEPPTHPQLLDWLAVNLRDGGWSMKRSVRTMVLSRTYRQSARVTPKMLRQDPDNKLLARGPRQRLAAEAVRDNALAVAGLLSDKMYGPPVFPPQPDGLWRVTGKVDNTYRTSTGEDRYRRGIYTIWRRSAPYPSFLNFDATDRSACVVKRARSNTPLQALTLLNDPVYVEAATSLAERIVADNPAGDATTRICYGYRLCLTRDPKPAELAHLLEMFAREKAARDEPAAWRFVATVLLNLDETITR